MPRDTQPPEITHAPDTHTDTVERHPAYGQIAASRVSGHADLYGSDFTHGHYMTVTIRGSALHRALSRDWYAPGPEFIEVALTEAQWAEFLSTPNSGSGTPCTIEFVRVEGWLPKIARTVDRRAQFAEEVRRDVQKSLGRLDALLAQLDEVKIGAKKKEELIMAAKLARQDIEANLPFVVKSFDDHMEQQTAKARMEIHGYMQHAITRAGLAAIAGAALPLLLGDDDTTEEER